MCIKLCLNCKTCAIGGACYGCPELNEHTGKCESFIVCPIGVNRDNKCNAESLSALMH